MLLSANQIQIVNTNTNNNNNMMPLGNGGSVGGGGSSSSTSPVSSSSSSSSSSCSLTSSNMQANKLVNGKFQYRDYNYIQQQQQQQQSPQSVNQNTTANTSQIQNYIGWLNSHLKKRPGVKLVENLQTDISSGVCLIHLIEVISGIPLTDVNLNPKTLIDYKENIEKILKFMQANQIKMHQTTSKEIIEGNLKSIMRLILALAAHFKPTNVQPYSNLVNSKNSNFTPTSSTTSSSTNVKRSQNNVTSKRSQSSNNVNRNQNNNTYVVEGPRVPMSPPASTTTNTNSPKNFQPHQQSNQLQQYANKISNSCSKTSSQNQTRNLDSMTHLVQAACVSLADVRRYKHENFNVKYVKFNNLLPPTNSSSPSSSTSPSTGIINKNFAKPQAQISNYLTPVNAQSNNQQYQTKKSNQNNKDIYSNNLPIYSNNNNNNNNIDETQSSISSSPPHGAPAASSTVIMVNNSRIETKTCRNLTYSKAVNDEILENKISNLCQLVNKENGKIKDQEQQTSTSLVEENQNQNQRDELPQFDFDNLEENLNDVQDLKKVLLNLQSLLMNDGGLDEESKTVVKETSVKNVKNYDNVSSSVNTSRVEDDDISADFRPLTNLTHDEEIAILRSKIQQLEILCTDLRYELNNAKSNNLHSNGTHSGLKQRLNEQDNTILEMKNENLNLILVNQQLVKSKEEMNSKMDEHLDKIKSLEYELAKRDDLIAKLKLDSKKVKQVSETLEIVQEKKNALDQKLANTGRKLLLINEIYGETHKKEPTPCLSDHLAKTSNNCSEASSLASSSANSPGVNQPSPLLSSASSTSSSSSSIFAKDSQSSQSSCSTMNKNRQSSNQVHQANTPPASTEHPIWIRKEEKNVEINIKQENIILNNEGNVKKIISRFLSQAPNSKNNNFNAFQQQQQSNQNPRSIITKENEYNSPTSTGSTLLTISSKSNQTNDSFKPSTKCIYYTEKSSAPYMVTIYKSIGTITLGDFKESIKLKNANSYRIYFKSQDPEFGFLKEEISNDTKILPTFENRIVAWIQEFE